MSSSCNRKTYHLDTYNMLVIDANGLLDVREIKSPPRLSLSVQRAQRRLSGNRPRKTSSAVHQLEAGITYGGGCSLRWWRRGLAGAENTRRFICSANFTRFLQGLSKAKHKSYQRHALYVPEYHIPIYYNIYNIPINIYL